MLLLIQQAALLAEGPERWALSLGDYPG